MRFLTWRSINPIKGQWLSNLYLGAALLSIPCTTANTGEQEQEWVSAHCDLHLSRIQRISQLWGSKGWAPFCSTDHLVGPDSDFRVQFFVCWFCARVGPVCTHFSIVAKKKIQTPSVPNLIRFPQARERENRVQVWELRNNSGIHQKWHRCHKKGVFFLEWQFS